MSEEKRTDFSALVGTGEDIVLDGKTLRIKPIGIKHFPDILTVQSAFLRGMSQDILNKKGKDEDIGIEEIKAIFGGLDDVSKAAMSRLVMASLEKSFPDNDKEELGIIGLKYGLPLIMHVIKVNSSKTHEETKKEKILSRLNASPETSDQQTK